MTPQAIQALLRQEFPHEPGLIHLNHAGIGPWPQRTAAAVAEFCRQNVARGSLDYAAWNRCEAHLRGQLAQLIHAPAAADVALLKSTSEALSFVAGGLDWQPGDVIVTADEEFPSNRYPWEALQRSHGVVLRRVALAAAPEQALLRACDGRTRLLTVSAVQYASGLRLDLETLGAYCRAHDILFCVDAIQLLGYAAMDVVAAQVDFAMADGHKWMLGPEGLALFYCAAAQRERLRLLEYGWHMVEQAGDYECEAWNPAPDARRFECGSPNMLGACALSASLSLLEQLGWAWVEATIAERVAHLVEAVEADPTLELVSPRQAEARAGIVTFRVQDADPAALHRQLQQRGVLCACRHGGLRFSPHCYTTPEQLDQALGILRELR